MARLALGGFDFAHEHADGLSVAGSTWAAPTYDAAVTRSGRGRSGKVVTTTAAGQRYWELIPSGPVNGDGIEYFFRVWVRFPAIPASHHTILQPMASSISTLGSGVALNTDGTISLGTNANPRSPVLAVDTWHCIEHRVVVYSVTGTSAGQGQWEEVRVNGSIVVSFRATTSQNGRTAVRWRMGVAVQGNITFASAFTCYFDDWALNNNQGASDTSYPGNVEQMALVPPNSDNTIGANWKKGDNTAPVANAYDSINNVPPTGKAVGSALAGDQLRDAVAPTSVAADQFSVNLQTYEAAGVSAGATIKAIQLVGEIAASTASAVTLGIQSTSNPVIAEATQATGASAAGTYSSNWTRIVSAISSNPAGVVTSTAPVLKMRYSAGSTAAMVSAAGAYVVFEPSAGQNVDLGGSTTTTVAGGLAPTPGALSKDLGGATTTTEAHGLAPTPGPLTVGLGGAEATALARGFEITPGALSKLLGASVASFLAGGLNLAGTASTIQLGHATVLVDAAGLSVTPGVKNTTLGSANPVFFAAGILVSTGPRNVLLGQALASFFANPLLVTFPRKRPGHLGLNPAGHYRSTGAGHYELHPPGEVRYDD